MAARDETYRNQKALDVIFALSCIAMLASLLWMFVVDHDREFKRVQRRAAEVEVALLHQQADELEARSASDVATARQAVESELASARLKMPSVSDDEFAEKAKQFAQAQLKAPARIELVQAETEMAALKATRDQVSSQRDQLYHERAFAGMRDKELQLQELRTAIDDKQRHVERLRGDVATEEKDLATRYAPLVAATDNLDRLDRERARRIKQAGQKQIGWTAKFRALPIIDAFKSPYRINQIQPDGLTLDYNFKQVQRNDRCTTCHLNMDRVGFDKDALRALGTAPEGSNGTAPVDLSKSEIATFCNHPRMDLFVGANSPHPVEKFGCTVCHSGQGGSATFNFAYHFPDAGKTDGQDLETYKAKKERWEHDHHWHADLHPNFLWDFPMMPARFMEATCVKCHHQVLDLVRTDGKEEAPKLLKGFRLVQDLGCFGCHEISGYKSGHSIGPDMRLEPYPPLDDMTPLERQRAESDPSNPPGTMRKVGPGLRRIAEKTNPDWTAKWIRSPRSFRPDTKMPHFFGLSNNTPHQLSDDIDTGYSQLDKGQMGFPDAEIQAMTFYLFKASELHLGRLQAMHEPSQAATITKQRELMNQLRSEELRREDPRLIPATADVSLPAALPAVELVARLTINPKLSEKLTRDQLNAAVGYLIEQERWRKGTGPLSLLPNPKELESGDGKNGELVFQKHGCAACHASETFKVYGNDNELLSKQNFGPNLQGLKEKLGFGKEKDASAQKWLFYWLSEPTFYHSRTFMPNPQLTPKERADLVAWLLNGTGNVNPPGEWAKVKVTEGDVKGLLRGYLEKAFPKAQAEEVLQSGLKDAEYLRPEADERILATNDQQMPGSPYKDWQHEDRLKYYLGRKTISRYGCYACHDIPGFDTAKPIGTHLNDWGRKDTERLAFDNITTFLKNFDHHVDPFYHDAIEAKRRDGFIEQKLKEPRSYDFGKMKDRPWDDRLKMPQFKFGNVKPRKGEEPSSPEYLERVAKAEAEGREAVATFILGLVAENMPARFVNHPKHDRMNEIKGMAVLEKYNCIGCHVVKPGSFEYPLDAPIARRGDEEVTARQSLVGSLSRKKDELDRDLGYLDSRAWTTFAPPATQRVTVRGLPYLTTGPSTDEEFRVLSLELWEAIRFRADGKTHTFPAAFDPVQVPLDNVTQTVVPYGGTYGEILARTLQRLENKNLVGDRPYLMGSVPPPLIREGQKVQPQWLHDFLRKPHGIRPTVYKNLLMPQFNFSPEEIVTLVNYFIAVDRLENPALGLEYFPKNPKLHDPAFLHQLRANYEAKAKDQGDKDGYFESAWTIMSSKAYCINCHNLGTFKAEGKPEENGPSLHWAPNRLRPEYVERWISFPKRLVPYTAMQQYDPFYANGMPPPAPIPPGGVAPPPVNKNLTPRERVQAVRDALLSWGFLPDPPPTAVKAGPPVDTTTQPPGEKKP